MVEADGGAVQVQYLVRTSGTYQLSVVDPASGEALPGCPLEVRAAPGPALPSMSRWEVPGQQVGQQVGPLRVLAGEELRVHCTMRDAWGNLAEGDPRLTTVTASCARSV